jgi:hypothetical protein
MKVMPEKFIDIFSIDDPEQYWCEIGSFSRVHSALSINVMKTTKPTEFFNIEFTSVEYFSGSLRWMGAKFELAPVQECFRILRRTLRFEKFTDDELINGMSNIPGIGYKLYISGLEEMPVKIVARRCNIFYPDE